jgi:hypothetical protein
VTYAVTSPFSKARWNAAECAEVTDTHERMALEAIGRTPEIGGESRVRMLVKPDGQKTPTQAVVVAIATFE